MARLRQIQQRFTAGEIDPAMIGRSDLEAYYSAAETLTNVETTPQGGVKRRGGLANRGQILKQLTRETSYTVTAPNGGTTGNLTDNNTGTVFTTTTNIGVINPYVVAQLDLTTSKNMGKVEMRGVSLSAGSSSEFFAQVSNDAASWSTVGSALSLTTTSKDYTRRVHGSYRYARLARIGTTDLGTTKVNVNDMQIWAEGAVSTVKFVPFIFNNDQTYMMVVTDKNIAVYKDKLYVIDIRAEDYTTTNLRKIYRTQYADTMVIANEDVPLKTLVRGLSDDIWTLANVTYAKAPFFNFVPVNTNPAVTITPSAVTGNVTLTAGAAAFTLVTDVGQYIEANGGLARIVSVTSTTVVTAFVEIPFINTTAVASGGWTLMRGYEAVWSATRGYPATCCFHDNRLVIGGSRDRPTTIWMSRVGDYFDYELGQQLADDAIEYTINNEYNEISGVYSGRALSIFTSGAEYVVNQTFGEPVAPETMSVRRQSSIGSEPYFEPLEFEGRINYIQRGGQSIQEFLYDDVQQAYNSDTVSLLSAHLVKNPTAFSLRKATSTDQGAYIVIVRSNGDGAIGNILRSQKITSFCRTTTDGLLISTGVEDEVIWYAVSREINGVTNYYLESLETDNLLDASVRLTTGLPTGTMSGLSHLEGETVKLLIDGSLQEDAIVTGGAITLPRDPDTSVEVGLDFLVTIKDLPVEVPQVGTVLGSKTNVSIVMLRLKETTGMKVNGKLVTFRGFGPSGGGSPLDAPPPEYTGVYRMQGFLGYDYTGQVTITQDSPAKMNLLAMAKKVRVQ
jgi:hypothetical protein